ncbi:flavodoxin-dependent (E)-4-hydroxy-3-methylbut-2-enyl-diphosphate synthase [Candidatus Desulfovibrio trichonymphae]|uniref:4-hydroxy-3-methylbut-2-en-1-yl diphosphate synthase (flavodoxin) n=1 Tax=Candidatus Desulfovibrio trichonymphae TaxID=1725232 RepID=A0A1J1DTN8_9BACT|nr:flavodoxin-dependent (E)-4-hydroxy-3-methylbut-2-enyl-diphosphate synthase [Candidatus Desulfovibrio trichonymphae]BAV92029.1 4-hydroxy-3-methylbut-2-en-1-yl diphosphate synthase [Candidatus Desulfovibrio trichonymphae]
MCTIKNRAIHLGSLVVGGGAPVMVQSMTNTDTRDVPSTLAQIERLQAFGCEAVRLAVPDNAAIAALAHIRQKVVLPIIADIHFDYRLAVSAVEAGVEGLRINPGNIGTRAQIFKVIDAAKAHKAVIRVGVNSGSLEKSLMRKYGRPCPEALVQSALRYVHLLEARGFYEIKISIKSSSVTDTIAAYRLLAKSCDYPLHIGITEAGGLLRGAVKSAVGLGILLYEGIGDTLRVSLTADPTAEIIAAWEILRSLGLRSRGPEIISCPTCGRTEIDIFALVRAVEDCLAESTASIKVAVMGCVVNGPGEAREVDIGLAGGRDKGIIFRKGRVIRSVKGQDALLDAFMEELQTLLNEQKDNSHAL